MLRCNRLPWTTGASCGALCVTFRFKSWTADKAELDREKQLRQKIQEQYRRMNLPEMTNIVYGKFASVGTSGTNQHGDTPTSSAFNNWSQPSGQAAQGPASVDWMMLLTGVALVLVATRLLAERFSAPTSDGKLVVPLWCVPFHQQAKYLLYLVATDKFVREQLEREFKEIKRAYPTVGFVDWLESRYPMYGCGKFVSRQSAVETISHLLASGGQMQLASLGRLVRDAVNQSGGDPQGKLDTFVAEAEKIAGVPSRTWPQGPLSSQWGQPTIPLPYTSQSSGQYHPQAMPYNNSLPHPMTSGAHHASGAQNVTMDDVLSSVQGSNKTHS